MKFALVKGDKTEARPGLQGACINCQSDMIAKCGQVKIWHWAHKSKSSCDPWWENETEWHRAWKNHFPTEWQENIHIDSTTGEKHIADIKTDKEFVIEFQHSAIKPDEIQSREAFYKNMVWVIDGTLLKRDYLLFCKGVEDFRPSIVKGFFLSFFPDECFPASWISSSVPVFFDFQGSTPIDHQDERRAPLYCLFPGRVDGKAVVAPISRKDFIEVSSKAPHLLLAQDIRSHIAQARHIQQQLGKQKLIENMRAEAFRRQAWINKRRGRNRPL